MFVFVLWQSGESTLVSVSASEIEESSCSFKAGRLRKVKQKKKKRKRERERVGVKWLVRLVSCEIEFMVFKTVNSIR